jgi:hypothetical protein
MLRIKQDNYYKRPTAEQRKVMHVLDIDEIIPFRIKAHLRIAQELGEHQEKKLILKAWRLERQIERDRRRATIQNQVIDQERALARVARGR